MSSWIPSIFNPSSSADDADDDDPNTTKENLSAVFRGVANFLAPPPITTSSSPLPRPTTPPSADSTLSSAAISGIKNDLAELQGTFKSGFSLISSKLASNFMQLGAGGKDYDDDGDDDEDVAGINEEVVEFVRKVSVRAELWTDFPLSLPDDFRLSDYQREHAASINHLVPELARLRQTSCSHMSEEKFWLIYFILLCPRLNEEDMELLSSPEVFDARETLLKKLKKKTNVAQAKSENSDSSDSDNGSDQDRSQRKDTSAENESSSKQRDFVTGMGSGQHSEEAVASTKHSENSEFSFSDLEDEDSDKVSRTESHVWVRHSESSEAESSKPKAWKSGFKDKESEGEDSTDWHNVDDTDFDNLSLADS